MVGVAKPRVFSLLGRDGRGNTYVRQAVESREELVQHAHQLLGRQRGGQVGEAFDICEKNAA